MRKIFLFMNVSLDGYFEGPGHDLSWTKGDFEAFSTQESQDVDTLLLGHRTYDMMKSFWPTPQAEQVAPEIANFMNERLKLVASRESFEPGWSNVRVIGPEAAAAVKQLKEGRGKNIIILGSNNLSTSLLQAGLLDELQILVNPIVLGAGTPLFAGLSNRENLRLKESRSYKTGTILLIYEPQGR